MNRTANVKINKTTAAIACLVCMQIMFANSVEADWPQFRGTNSAGIATDANPPIEFGPGKNEVWQVPMASGHSSPCIVGNSIFLTTYDDEQKKLAVVCIDRSNGKTRWSTQVPTEKIEKGHPSFNPASSTPASDGERVVAYFGSYGLICLDMDGQKLWDVKMPVTKSYNGNATSPVITGDRVILYRGNFVDHFLLAVDKKTGKEIWKVPQQERFSLELACTSTPIISGGKIILHSARSVQAVDITSGKQAWLVKCATTATSTPIIADNEVIVAAWHKFGEPSLRPAFPSFEQMVTEHDQDEDGLIDKKEFPVLWIFHRPEGTEAPLNGMTIAFKRSDKNKDSKIDADEWTQKIKNVERFRSGYKAHGLLAIPINSQGLLSTDDFRTLEIQSIPEVPSPLFDGVYIYFVKNGGILTCLELKTGKRIYRMRTQGRGTHYASPLIADGKLFISASDGSISVLTLGPNPETLATNDLEDEIYATPAIVDDTIYVRTRSTLTAYRKK